MAENDANRPAVNITVVGLSDVGRVREHNEDNFLVLDTAASRKQANGERRQFDVQGPVVLAVADGMGGAAAGEVASALAVERFSLDMGGSDLKDVTPDQLMAKIDQALQAANDDILKDVEANSERKGMGTTFTSAVVVGGTAFVAQVGDSRGYLLRKGKLHRLTRDQSLIEQLIEEGTITEEEAEKMGGHNIILQALGVEQHVRPDTKAYPILRGDTYLLCSDGLSGMVKDDQMERILNQSGDDLVEAVQKLVQSANENGGKDNITVVLARFEGEGLRPPMAAIEPGDIERTGVKFQAPPPPEVPNPMKRLSIIGGAIIAVLLAILMFAGKRSTDLKLTFSPPELAVDVTLTDAQGNTVATASAAKGSHTIPDLPLGTYTLVVRADKYFEKPVNLTIQESGALDQQIEMDPRPAELTLRCAVTHTEFELRSSRADAEPFKGLLEPENPAPFRNFPVGKAHLTAHREGFADYDVELDVGPAETLTHAIELKEQKGTVEVTAPEPGFKVRVRDRWGEERADEAVVGAEPLRLQVRTGDLDLEATKPGFEAQNLQVSVTPGGTAKVTIPAVRVRVSVSFRTTASFEGDIDRKDEQGAWVSAGVRAYKRDGEKSRAVRLEPGQYRLTYRVGDAEREHVFEVAPDAVGTEIVVDL